MVRIAEELAETDVMGAVIADVRELVRRHCPGAVRATVVVSSGRDTPDLVIPVSLPAPSAPSRPAPLPV